MKKILNEFELYLGTLCFILMTIFLFLQVFSRYVFNSSLSWTEELSVILFVWMVYFGSSAAVLKRKHLRIDFLINLMPPKLKRISLVTSNLLFIVFCGLTIMPLMEMVGRFARSGASTTILNIPKSLVYVVIPLSLILTSIRLVQESIIVIKEEDKNVGVVTGSLNIEDSDTKG